MQIICCNYLNHIFESPRLDPDHSGYSPPGQYQCPQRRSICQTATSNQIIPCLHPRNNPSISSIPQSIHPSMTLLSGACSGSRILPAPLVLVVAIAPVVRLPSISISFVMNQYRTKKPHQANRDLDVLLHLDLLDLYQVKTRTALGRESIVLHIWLHEAGNYIFTGRPGCSTGRTGFLRRCRLRGRITGSYH